MNGFAVQTITVQALYERSRSQPIELIDVRTPEEFRNVRAVGARNVPMDTIDPRKFAGRNGDDAEPVYFICKMGGRSGYACAALMAAGSANVVNVEGGTDAWIEAGLPTEQ